MRLASCGFPAQPTKLMRYSLTSISLSRSRSSGRRHERSEQLRHVTMTADLAQLDRAEGHHPFSNITAPSSIENYAWAFILRRNSRLRFSSVFVARRLPACRVYVALERQFVQT